MKKRHTNLSEASLKILLESGISAKVAATLGFRELSVAEMQQSFGIKTTGFLIPYDNGFARARTHGTFLDSSGKPRKYTQAKGSPVRLYLPGGIGTDWEAVKQDNQTPLTITEGEKKCVPLNLAGVPTIGLGGVSSWGKRGILIPDWSEFQLQGRHISIVYDSDIITKRDVQVAERALAAELVRRGAIVDRIVLPSTIKGVDDFLVANGFPKDVRRAHTAFMALARQSIEVMDFSNHLTDLGNGAYLAMTYGDIIRFLPENKTWLVYNEDTGLWQIDRQIRVMQFAKDTIRQRYESVKSANTDAKDKLKKAIRRLEAKARLENMIKLMQSEPGVSMDAGNIDKNRWLLGLGDGRVFDLQIGEARTAVPEDYITKSVGVTFDPTEKCPLWLKFLEEIFLDNRQMIHYVHKAIGYSLGGQNSEQCFFVMNGGGANGKSTMLRIISLVAGNYATTAQPDTFMLQRFGTTLRNDVARLMTARIVCTTEVADKDSIDESLIKQWTGEDAMTSRYLYEEHSEMVPQGKIWFATNNLPKIKGTDDAIWRRLHIIPFEATFDKSRRDPKLYDKLAAEGSGILNWALQGYQIWKEEGLQPPTEVCAAIYAHRAEMDQVGRWIEDCCIIGDPKEVWAQTGDLYANYKEYAARTGETQPLRHTDFTREMMKRKYAYKQTTLRGKQGRFFLGIGLSNTPGKYRAA